MLEPEVTATSPLAEIAPPFPDVALLLNMIEPGGFVVTLLLDTSLPAPTGLLYTFAPKVIEALAEAVTEPSVIVKDAPEPPPELRLPAVDVFAGAVD